MPHSEADQYNLIDPLPDVHKGKVQFRFEAYGEIDDNETSEMEPNPNSNSVKKVQERSENRHENGVGAIVDVPLTWTCAK